MTKIFCDIADIKLIKKFNGKKIVKGFTTNPTLFRKAGAKNYYNYAKKIISLTNKPVSLEVFADEDLSMIDQGKIISKIGKIEGRISSLKKGKNGFGYDPIFIPKGKRLTFGEMDPHKKYGIDHRSNAFKKIKKFF